MNILDTSSFERGIIGDISCNGLWINVSQSVSGNNLYQNLVTRDAALSIIAKLVYEIVSPSLIFLHTVTVSPDFMGKGLVSELMLFVDRGLNYRILYDPYNGATTALIKSLVASSHFERKIIYTPTMEIYSYYDTGDMKTKDGVVAYSPSEEQVVDIQRKRCFHLIRSKEYIIHEQEGRIYCGQPHYRDNMRNYLGLFPPRSRMHDSDF